MKVIDYLAYPNCGNGLIAGRESVCRVEREGIVCAPTM